MTNINNISKPSQLNESADKMETSIVGKLQEKEVTHLPVASDVAGKTAAVAALGVCFLGLGAVTAIAGGIMWGVCNDSDREGCNEEILKAGKIMVITGSTIIGTSILSICGSFGYANYATWNDKS